jgi:hypothetical protein
VLPVQLGVIYNQLGHFCYLQGAVLKNLSVMFLPDVPPEIQHDLVEFEFLFFYPRLAAFASTRY